MKTRDEILLKFAESVEQDARKLTPKEIEEAKEKAREEEFRRRKEPGFAKRRPEQFEGTVEYDPGKVKKEVDVSRGYGISKRNAKILSVEDPVSYVHKHKYHLVEKLNEITNKMLMDIIQNYPEKYFEYRFHYVPEFKQFDFRAFRELAQNNPIELIRKKIFEKEEFTRFLMPLFGLARDKLNISDNDLKFFSTKLRAISDEELRSGLHDLVFLIRARTPDDFFEELRMLRYDPYFSELFTKEDPGDTRRLSMKLRSEIVRRAIDILERLPVPPPPRPGELGVAPPKPADESDIVSLRPIEVPEKEEPFKEEAIKSHPLPPMVANRLSRLPNAEVESDKFKQEYLIRGYWQGVKEPQPYYEWEFEAGPITRGPAFYTAQIIKVIPRGKAAVVFEATDSRPLPLLNKLMAFMRKEIEEFGIQITGEEVADKRDVGYDKFEEKIREDVKTQKQIEEEKKELEEIEGFERLPREEVKRRLLERRRKSQILYNLVKAANQLDSKGLYDKSEYIDSLVNKLIGE